MVTMVDQAEVGETEPMETTVWVDEMVVLVKMDLMGEMVMMVMMVMMVVMVLMEKMAEMVMTVAMA